MKTNILLYEDTPKYDSWLKLFLGGEIAAIGGGSGSYVIGITVLGHTMTIFEDVLVVAIFGSVMLLIAA